MENQEGLSRKERRALKRAEKNERREKEEKQERQADFTQNMLTWGLVSLLGVGLILFVVGLVRSGGNILPPANVDIALAEDEWIAGAEEAEVTLVEYGDFQCPACGAAHGFLDSLLAEYGDSFRLAYRHYPLPFHQNAYPAARAAEAAGLQGQFFAMHDLLFENQDAWSGERNPYSIFEGYASELGLDVAQFEQDFNSEEVAAAVDADRASGNEFVVVGTPTFFLNGERLADMSFAEIQEALVTEIEEAAAAPAEDAAEGDTTETEGTEAAQ